MVLEKTLNNLRERPQNERTAIAAWIAIGVVAILFVGWLIYFLHTIATTPPPNLQSTEDSLSSSGIPQAAEQMQQAYGSTTQFIQAQGTIELQQISTSTEPQQ
jgi:hypothetical protein